MCDNDAATINGVLIAGVDLAATSANTDGSIICQRNSVQKTHAGKSGNKVIGLSQAFHTHNLHAHFKLA